MALVATYGDTNHYNIKIYDLSGGGYFAMFCDGATDIWQRQGQAADLTVGGAQDLTDRFTSYSFDSPTNTLTLSGAIDTYNSVTYTRSHTYRFCDPYVIEDSWTITANATGSFSMTNYNVYSTKSIVFNIDNQNDPGNFSSTVYPLGLGMKTTAGSPVYACIADNKYNNKNCNAKGALSTASGIFCTRAPASGSGSMTLTAGEPVTITQFIFQCTYGTKPLIRASHEAIATAKGYTGTQFEKICKTTAYLNLGLSTDLLNILCIPSYNYAYGMWLRDSYWQSFQVSDEIEQQMITRFESKVHPTSGAIPYYIGADNVALYTFDESAFIYLMRAYYDREVRGLTVSTSVCQGALNWIESQVINDQFINPDGGAGQGMLDAYIYPADVCVTYLQGLYVLGLKCAKALGLTVSQVDIDNATAKYIEAYDVDKKYMRTATGLNLVSPDALVAEAFSLFILGEPILSDEIVNNHISYLLKNNRTACGLKTVCNEDGSYINGNNWTPFLNDGEYQNGGSWWLVEFLAYYCGYYHGYPGSYAMIQNRNNQEIAVNQTTHEYLVTTPGSGIFGTEEARRHCYAWVSIYLAMKPPPRQPVI